MPAITITDLENAKQDVDHIGTVANSTALTATDRLGRTKRTLAGLEAEFPNAQANSAAAAASATLAEEWATKTTGEVVVGQGFGAKKYADEAQGAEGGAQLAQAQAEFARDSAWFLSGLYPDTATAVADAGLVVGKYFGVLSGTSSQIAIVYRKVAGPAATDTGKRIIDQGAVLNLLASIVPGADYAILDGSDNAGMFVEDGAFNFQAVDADAINDIPRSQLARAVRRSLPNLTASYVGHISYGQSLSVGANAVIHTRSDVEDGFFDSVRFNANGGLTAGPRAQDGSGTVAQNHASFVAYVEQVNGSGFGETPLGNCLRTVKRLLRDEDGIATTDYDYILVGSAPGQANITISGLSKGGGVYYQRVIDDVTYGKSLANAAGKSYAVDVVYWSQGEADATAGTARATYTAALQTLYTNLNTDIKALTGQTHDIKLIAYQMSWGAQPNNTIALAQLDAAKANSNIILATASYAVEHIAATDAHLDGFGSASLGAYYGLAAKRVVVDGESWANLYPSRLTRQGTILDIEMPDTGYPWAISSALFPTQANAGFTALRADNVTDNPITSVTVVGPRRIRIVLTNAEAGKLRYGFATWGGNLHDTTDVDPGTAREGVLYRPCLTFEETYS